MKSVKNIQKVTKGMEKVAGSKLRVVHVRTGNFRGLWKPLTALLGDTPSLDVKKNGIITITSDKGLCGDINLMHDTVKLLQVDPALSRFKSYKNSLKVTSKVGNALTALALAEILTATTCCECTHWYLALQTISIRKEMCHSLTVRHATRNFAKEVVVGDIKFLDMKSSGMITQERIIDLVKY